jgi:adenylylsulfate kinase
MVAIWLTGLSGSGKTTIAEHLSKYFINKDVKHEVLDGDLYRSILSPRDGYSKQERDDFRYKVLFIAELLIKNEVVCIIPLLSSTRDLRDEARSRFDNFVEVYVKCPIEVCEKRDPKGHYKKVRKGELKEFVGFDIPYEEPLNPELIIESDKINVFESVKLIVDYLSAKKINI